VSRWRKINKCKRNDPHCRNHGQCPSCRDARTYQERKAKQAADEQLKAREEYFSRKIKPPVPLNEEDDRGEEKEEG